MLDTTTTLTDVLYPPIEAHTTGMLAVSDVHTIAWEQSGNPMAFPSWSFTAVPGWRSAILPAVLTPRRSTSCSLTSEAAANPRRMLNWRTTTRTLR